MNDRMPFGKYKGRLLRELPADYLRWLHDACDLREPLRQDIEAEYQRRFRSGSRAESPPAPALVLPPAMRQTAVDIVRAGYRALTLRRHPDHGGHHDQMVELTKVRDTLLQWLRVNASKRE
jgi:Putative quorum-sensing-regulated virulence factor